MVAARLEKAGGARNKVLGFSPTAPVLAIQEYMTEDELNDNPELERLVLEHRKISKNKRYMSWQIFLWSVPKGKLLGALPGAHGFLGFDRDGNLACYGPKGGIHLWSVPKAKHVVSFGDDAAAIPGPANSAQNYYFGTLSADGRYLAYANDQATRVWSLADQKLVAKIDSRTKGLFSMAFSPDGRLLATSGDSTDKCRLWSVPSGKVLATLGGYAGEVAFSPYGRVFATVDRFGSSAQTALWVYAPVDASGDGLDWSPANGGTVGKLEVKLTGRKAVYAGDEFWLDLTLRNTGKGDLAQVWAETQSEALHLTWLGCVVGRVKAGEIVQRRLSGVLPPDHPAGNLKGSLLVHQAGAGSTAVSHGFGLEVKPLPRPDFILVANPAELRLRRGKALGVPVLLKNHTGADIPRLKVAVRILEGVERVTVKPASLDFGTVPDQMNAERQIELHAKDDAPAGRAIIDLRAEDDRGRVFAVQQFVMAVKE